MMFSTWLRNWKRSLECQSARKQTRRRKSPVRRMVPRPRLEFLEDRVLLSAYVVTTTADSGAGSLRDAINQINADTSHALYASPSNPNVDEIDFNITAASDTGGGFNSATGVATIKPLTALPAIYNAVVINGYTQALASQNTLLGPSALGSTDSTLHPENYGDNAVLKVELDGENAGTATGLDLEAANITVQGLVINRFANDGMVVHGNSDVIQGNFIGTDVTGTQAQGNHMVGVFVQALNDTIGGTTPAARNIISGNGDGIGLSFAQNAVVQGNFIGTDVTGRNSLGNANDGIGGLANNNLIGGSIAGAGNVISGNGYIGVDDDAYGTPDVIEGNLVGTDVTGTKAVGNHNGVWLGAGGGGGILGGTAPEDGNVISGNGGLGIRGFGSNIAIEGNLIGTDVTGTKALGNGGIGIDFQDGGNNDLIGGLDTNAPGQPLAGGGNVITDGISFGGDNGPSHSLIEGNYIGTDITGMTSISGGGVGLGNGASYNTIGGTTAAARNIISGSNGAWGADIDIGDESGGTGVNLPSNNLVEGNYIGTDATGTVVLGNGNGVFLHGAINNTIGGTSPRAGNLIMGGQYAGEISGHGIYFWSNGNPNGTNNGNVVQGNTIKDNWEGMLVSDGTGNAIGGTAAGAGNVISDNANGGIYLGSAGNFVEGNNILTNTGNGVTVYSSNNTLGGTASGAGNVISGNSGDGVLVGNGASGVSVLGNSISASGGLGIHLDSTSNANDNQAAPVLEAAATESGKTYIGGVLSSAANTTFRIEFFANASPDPSGYGEGDHYLGFVNVSTDAAGNADFIATFAGVDSTHPYISATATRLDSVTQAPTDTSAFSNNVNALASPAAYVVTTTADSGAGSLRDAINQINADTSHALYASPSNPNVDEIDFNIPTSDAGYQAATQSFTIQPMSALPTITNAVIINGYSQSGATPNTLAVGDNAVLKIDLDGSQAGLVNGLNIGSNSTVEGLAVTNFGNGQVGFTAPVAIEAGGNNQIIGDFIGTDVTGTVEEGNGMGVVVYGAGNTIGGTDPAMRNVIGGNATFGVWLYGGGNVVEGSYIGTDQTGTKALGNLRGVNYVGSNNTIGGSTAGARNVISGNESDGIEYGNFVATTGDVIQGNFIGTDATGTVGLGNGLAAPIGYDAGISIGPTDSATITGNVISANPYGIQFNGSVVIQGNLIGTDATGKTTTGTDGKSLGNTQEGITAGGPATIGGTTAAARNVISGNATGIDVQALEVVIQGNYIGTDITGTHALGNDGSYSNYGLDAGAIELWGSGTVVENLISGNGIGIDIRGEGAGGHEDGSGTAIQGNLIGTDYTGTQPLGNARGILFQSGGSNYTIGGTIAGAGNVISGNGYGISMVNYGTPPDTGNAIEGNFIGTNAAGATNLGNGTGVYLEGGYSGTQIGGTTAAAANVIADNGGSGIYFYGSSGNVIQGNSIIGNGDAGVHLIGSSNTMVGGTTSGAGNTISFNKGDGILLTTFGTDAAGLGNSFLGNSIHDNAAGIGFQSPVNPNAPVLTTATSSATNTTISGTLASVANTTFRIEFFSNADLDASGTTAEGLTYLGFTTVTTDSNGNASFTATNLAAIPVGQGYLTATATNQSTGDTSQFSNYLTAPTSTVLTSSANPSLLNQSVTFTATVSSSFGTPTGGVDFVDTTTNTDLGTFALSTNGTASITASNLAVGSHAIEAVYAGQGFFLGSSGTLTQQVSYKFSGFLPPLSNGLAFAVNRTIPIKFTLSDFNGTAITSLSAVTSLQIFNSQGVDVLGGNGVAGLSVSGSTYAYSWQTKGMPAGSYTISVKLADGTTQTKTIQLTSTGNGSNAQATDGSDVSGGSAAGQLLGGNLGLYVDNSNGDLTPDELARIQDAVNSVDATIAPYGVAIDEVTDPTQADVTLNMGTNSAVGGYANGILGCYTTTGAITLIQGWNWYAGADPTQIGSNQYDFQTTVTHELGHALGLGESSTTTSAMYGTLTPGTTIRTLTTADLNIPYDDGSNDAQRAAPLPISGSGSIPISGQGMTAPSNPGVPSSSLSAADQILAELNLLLSAARNAYQSELSFVAAMWQNIDALALQHLDALLSLQAGAMGITKDSLMRDLLFASLSSPSGV